MVGNRRRLQVLIALVALVAVVVLMTVVYPRTTYFIPDRGGSYVEAVAGEPKFLNPILATADSIDSDLTGLIFSGLIKLDNRGTPIPDLASSWQVSGDNKTYTFVLRPDVQWQDGVPITADDVVFTVQAMQDAGFQGAAELAQVWRNVRAQALDPHTVRFQLADAYSPFLEFTSIGLLPAHVLRGLPAKDLPGNPFNARPIGSGPFRVKAVSRDELVLEASAKYYGQAPYLSTLRFRFYPDEGKAVNALRRQEVGGVRKLAPEKAADLASDKHAAIYSSPDLSKLTLLLFNTRAPLFSDPVIRQAIAYGLNRQGLIDVVLAGQGTRANGPILPGSWAYKRDLQGYEYRPDQARVLLGGAGWTAGPDGIRQRDGNRLAFVLLTNDAPQRVKTAQEISHQLAGIGIAVEVQATGWTGVVQDFLVPRRFQAVLTEQWSPNFDPDPYPFWHSSQIAGGLNFSSWTNRRADDALENARRTSDQEVRRTLYDEFQSTFLDELPAVPLYYPQYTFAVDRAMQGVRLGPLVASANRFDHIADWYVKTKAVSKLPSP